MPLPPGKPPNLTISSAAAPSPSTIIKQEVAKITAVFKQAADRNVTGPEATAMRRIEGRVNKALPKITQMEKRLQNIASANRAHFTRQLKTEVEDLLRDIEMDTLQIRMNLNAPPGTAEKLKQKLPPWLRNRIDEGMKHKGLPVGVGAIRPAKVNTAPGSETKGIMPNGLEWLYSF